MVCILCGSKTQVINSRPQKRLNQVWRRRQCLSCQTVFTSEESVNYGASWVIKVKNSGLQPFSRDKLFLSLYNSCRHRPTALSDASALTDTVVKRLLDVVDQNGGLEDSAIARTVQVALNRFDKAASSHYAAYHKS